MAGTKEIRVKIASVKSTQKITKAMEMVAASKMRRAQDRMRAARPYADKIRSVIGHLRAEKDPRTLLEAWRRSGHTVTDAVPAKPARDKGRDRPRRERGGRDESPRKAKK